MRRTCTGFEPGELATPLFSDDVHTSFMQANHFDGDEEPLLEATPKGKQKQPKPRWKVALLIVMSTSLWWTSGIVAILVIKSTVSASGIYPHPFAFTTLVQPATGLLALLVSKFVYRKRPPRPSLTWPEVVKLGSMGIFQGMEIGLTNKALGYLSVAARTMISSTNVLFMMATSWLWGLEPLGWLRGLSGLLLVIGGVCQGADRGESQVGAHTLGIALQATAMLLAAQRWAIAQFVMQHSPADSALGHMAKLQILSRTLPLTGVVCIPLALVFEPGAYSAEQVLQPELLQRVLLVAFGLAGMLYAELKLVKLLSAVAFNVLSTVHQIPIILAGVLFQHNHVGRMSILGFSFCLVGALVYTAARQADRDHH